MQTLCDADQRTPELAVGVDDDAAALVRHQADVAEDRLEIEGKRDEVGQDHVVELLVADELLAGADDELEALVARPGEGDHLGAEVDTHST